MFEIILIANLVLLYYQYRARRNILSIYLLLVFFYQYSYPLSSAYFPDYFNSSGFNALAPSFSDKNILEYLFSSLLFQIFIIFGYICLKRLNFKNTYDNNFGIFNFTILKIVSVFILLLGIVSVFNGAGQQSISTYNEFNAGDVEISEKTRSLAYGFALLPVAFFYIVEMLNQGFYKKSAYIFLCCIPMIYEIFSAGRRQAFIPTFFVVLAYLFQKNMVSRKKIYLYIPIFVIGILLIFGIQFSLRSVATGNDSGNLFYGDDFIEGIFLPQFGEFISVGATSLSAYILFLDRNTFEPFGVINLVTKILSSLPGIRLIYLSEAYPNPNFDIKFIAPYGALSIFAEAIMYLGSIGILIFGFLLGCYISFVDLIIKKLSNNNFSSSLTNIFSLCLVALLFFKYRSGINDSISSAIFFLSVSFLVYVTSLFSYKKY